MQSAIHEIAYCRFSPCSCSSPLLHVSLGWLWCEAGLG